MASYLVVVRRGSMRVNYPVTDFGLMETPGQLAMSAVEGLAHLMMHYPDHEGRVPFANNNIPIILMFLDEEGNPSGPMEPTVSMKRQFEGKWKDLDLEAIERLGIDMMTDEMKNCNAYIELELKEALGTVS